MYNMYMYSVCVCIQCTYVCVYNVHICMYLCVSSTQTKDIIEYLRRLSKTSIPDGIVKFIEVKHYTLYITQ